MPCNADYCPNLAEANGLCGDCRQERSKVRPPREEHH